MRVSRRTSAPALSVSSAVTALNASIEEATSAALAQGAVKPRVRRATTRAKVEDTMPEVKRTVGTYVALDAEDVVAGGLADTTLRAAGETATESGASENGVYAGVNAAVAQDAAALPVAPTSGGEDGSDGAAGEGEEPRTANAPRPAAPRPSGGITPENTVFVSLCFEGPDVYATAGGLGTRVAEFTESLAQLGYETHLIFVGDPNKPAV